ncbi:hypothetical protein AP058_01535 [Flavobacterium sp. TAB 87]|nr:hypothetical protein AP058_01535 [Flavobacterium sp. TAB 87]
MEVTQKMFFYYDFKKVMLFKNTVTSAQKKNAI